MLISPNVGSLLAAGLLFAALSFGAAVVALTIENLAGRKGFAIGAQGILGASIGIALVAWLLSGSSWGAFLALALLLGPLGVGHRVLRHLSAAGRWLFVSHIQTILLGLLWGGWFLTTIPVSSPTRGLMFTGYSLLALTMLGAPVQTLEQWEVLCPELAPPTRAAASSAAHKVPQSLPPRPCLL